MNKLTLIASILVVLAGCAADGADGEPASEVSAYALSLPPASVQQILDLVNYPGTDLNVLDVSAGLDSRAATNIIAKRDGADGVSPSGDDVVFATIAQLDAVSQVGDAALAKLQTYAAAHPAPAGETVEGVVFQGWEAEAVVWGVNHATSAQLDAMLDDRAAASLVAGRPFTSVAKMGPLSYVGATALNGLLGGAPGWWSLMHGAANSLAGRFDGAIFSEADAETALAIVNQATQAELTAHGITTAPAKTIIAGRPFTSLATVSSLSGVGSATMNALLAYAQSGQWGASCVDTFDAAVGPKLPDLLFLSESDRPFDLVSFAGAGGVAPTAASVAALVHAPADSRLYTRSADDFYNNLEPMDSPSAAAVQAAFKAQLTDIVYIAIQPAEGTLNDALVDVYLVGRDACGDLVGIHSISVET